MSFRSYEQAARFEHGFWLQVLGDHGRFIHDALAPSQKEEIEAANYFIQVFDHLLSSVNTADLLQLSRKADEEANKIRAFKLEIIRKHLAGEIKIQLGPTFINHMVNEVEEYIRVLKFLQKGEIPPIYHELHHHLVWLLDAAGHAGAIDDNMDRIEKKIKEKSAEYTKNFENFYLKAVELAGFLRANVTSFPALAKFNRDVSLEMKLFMGFLAEIEELELSKQALGTFHALMADHMSREECYYLTKVAQSTKQPAPHCDPTKPRVQA